MTDYGTMRRAQLLADCRYATLKTAVLAAIVSMTCLCSFSATAQGAVKVELASESIGSPGAGAGQLFTGPTDLAVNYGGEGGSGVGDVYVSDFGAARVQEFTKAGAFVRAWGWDVVASGQHDTGANEQQSVTVKATGGSFTLTATVAQFGKGVLTNGSNVITGVDPSLGSFHVGDAITGNGIQPNTTITAVNEAEHKLELSLPASTSVTAINLLAKETTTAISATATSAELEAALEAKAGIADVTVIGGPGDSTGSSPYLVTFSGGPLAHDDIAQMTFTNVSLSGGSPSSSVALATSVSGGGYEVCQAGSLPSDTCKFGTETSAAAGALRSAQGIAIDQVTGNVYVADQANRRINVFSAVGRFEGAFGWGVRTGAAEFQYCTIVTGCVAPAAAGALAGQFASPMKGLAVDPTDGHLLVASTGNARIDEFAPSLNGSNEVVGVSFSRSFGWDVVASGPDNSGTGFEVCLSGDICKAGAVGNDAGQFASTSSLLGIAVDINGNIYATDAPSTCSAAAVCRVQKFSAGSLAVSDFAPATLSFAPSGAGAATPKAPRVAIDPSTNHVFALVQQGGSAFRVVELDEDGNALGTSPPELQAPLTLGTTIAVGTSERVYVLQSLGTATVRAAVLGPVPAPTVEFGSVDVESPTRAKYAGTVTVPTPGSVPPDQSFNTTYWFEVSANGSKWRKAPIGPASVGSTAGAHGVELIDTALDPSTEYLVKLVGCTSTCVSSNVGEFSTAGAAPRVSLTFAEGVSQTAAILGGHVKPESQATTYHFEWATDEEWNATGTYGHRIPAFDRQIGSGSKPVVVQDSLSGLKIDSGYHFRLVAKNAEGTTIGPDTGFSTLNSCGLLDDRCYELVSPADKGAVGEAGENILGGSPRFRVSDDGSSVGYVLGYGLADATAGGDIFYRSDRSTSGWNTTQMSPAMVAPAYQISQSNTAGYYQYVSSDLSCGVLVSGQPLGDAPRETIEAGRENLLMRGPSGPYTAISNLVPTNLIPPPGQNPAGENTAYFVRGTSSDCKKVVFTSEFHYPNIGGVDDLSHPRLYEWDHGTLRNVGEVPGSGGLVDVLAAPGAGLMDYFNGVSGDGSTVFFTAVSQLGADAGTSAVFMRKVAADGTVTVKDVSQSQGPVPTKSASYQTANPTDGKYVFFLANYGLTAVGPLPPAWPTNCALGDGLATAGTGRGCDLYRYAPDTGDLVDLSRAPDTDANGAGVATMLAASDDGKTAYFAARAQLVPEMGQSFAENEAGAKAYNVYAWREGQPLKFVGLLNAADVNVGGSSGAFAGITHSTIDGRWSSRVSQPVGDVLLFQSSADVTGYQSGNAVEAYLYRYGSGETVCVSCRRDEEPALPAPRGPLPMAAGHTESDVLHPPLTLSDDGRRVFFSKLDALAYGAVEGKLNLYEWNDGQIVLLARGVDGLQQREGAKGQLAFAGASRDGSDVFISTPRSLVAQDTDGRADVYDVRVNGGTPPPPSSPACDPVLEGSCQVSSPSGGVSGRPASETASSLGNQTPAKAKVPRPKCRRGFVRKRGKCVRKRGVGQRAAHAKDRGSVGQTGRDGGGK